MQRVMQLLICLMLGSVAAACGGCASGQATPAPTVLSVHNLFTPCPRPEPLTAETLAAIAGRVVGNEPFDGPANVDALTARHQAIRAYVRQLEAVLTCYEAQAEGGSHE